VDTQLLCVIATGTNNVDIPAASELGIRVCNVQDYAAAAVSQHVFMLILALYTRFLDYQRDMAADAWQAQNQFCLLNHPIRELAGKTLGLIGYGHIARAVESVARAFGLRVIVANSLATADAPQSGRLPLEQLLQQADIVSLHCPLSDLSRNLIAREQFALMKNEALIINTARGGIINEADLLDALKTGQIGGAGIDCLATEPPRHNDPMINARLPNLIITPHNAWGTIEARQRLVDGTCNNIAALIEDKLDTPGHPASLNP
jgi:glycerate dehydrogenase